MRAKVYPKSEPAMTRFHREQATTRTWLMSFNHGPRSTPRRHPSGGLRRLMPGERTKGGDHVAARLWTNWREEQEADREARYHEPAGWWIGQNVHLYRD